MISIDSSHPDVEEFIDLKTDLDNVTKANKMCIRDSISSEKNEILHLYRSLESKKPRPGNGRVGLWNPRDGRGFS